MSRNVTVEVVWEEPPATATQGGTNELLLEALRALKQKPDEWARVGVWEGSSGAYAARKRLVGGLMASVPGKFEFRIAPKYGDDEKGSALYARYLSR